MGMFKIGIRVKLKAIGITWVLGLILLIAGCGTVQTTPPSSETLLSVVATTTIVGDIVGEVAGDKIDLTILLPPGDDPHGYELTPKDIATLQGADIIFINGLGFERFLDPILENALTDSNIISVSEGIDALTVDGQGTQAEPGSDLDPHVWFDPIRVMTWVGNIEESLTHLDPKNGDVYRNNAVLYRQELIEIDSWISDQLNNIQPSRRLLVTNHDSLRYLVDRYQLRLVGTVIPGYSTISEPSAQDMAQLVTEIKRLDIPAIFIDKNANNSLAAQIGRDTDIRVIQISTGSLSQPDGESSTYLEFMRVNIETIVDALNDNQ
jgi:ABC-type Zn uptake system ZnuABC Zn-binding protein ZnuA